MPRIKEVLAEKNISQNQFAILLANKHPFIRKAIMSNIANIQLLPTKDLLNSMCEILGVKPNDLYSFEELDFKNYFVENRGVRTPLKLKSVKNISSKIENPYKLTVPIEKKDRDLLFSKEVLDKYGVKSIREFVRLIIKEKIEEVKEHGN